MSWLLLSASFADVVSVNNPCTPSHGYAYLPSVTSAVEKCDNFQHWLNIFSVCSVNMLVQLLSQYMFVRAPQLKNIPWGLIFTLSTLKLTLIEGIFDELENALAKETMPLDEALDFFIVHDDRSMGDSKL